MSQMVHFEVGKGDLRRTRFVEEALPAGDALADGQILVEVQSLAFTANNVTYGVLGESLSYFAFFPAAEGWGRIPAWGFGQVKESKNGAIPPGTRVFGYFPMSSHVVLTAKGSATGFVDVAAHRENLPPIYNRYDAWSLKDDDVEARVALFRPLFATAFLLDDWLADEKFFGARRLLITSASAKTAFSLAALVARRPERPKIVGLTSAKNRDFVQSLGVYDEVVLYDDIASLPLEPTVSVDIAGSEPVGAAIHSRLRDHLVFSSRVGAAHWEQSGSFGAQPDWPGPKPQFFFAPSRAQECVARWGPVEFLDRIRTSMEKFLKDSRGGWLEIARATERTGVEHVYRATLAGDVKPSVGHIVSIR